MNSIEILDLGLVYYKNAIINPEQIIKEVEDLDKKILNNKNKTIKTMASPWHPWNDKEQFFCWQKFFIPQEQINKDDFFYDEIYNISKKLFSPLDEYLKNSVNVHKIVVMKEPTKRSAKQITTDYINVEFFFEYEMMEDIPSKIFIPEHTLLLEKEKKSF